MSDDLRGNSAGAESAKADGRLTDPGFLVNADPRCWSWRLRPRGRRRGWRRRWDLTTGCWPVGKPLTGHTSDVNAVATAVVNGRPVAVTGSEAVRVWDLATGRQVGERLGFGMDAVVTAVVSGRPVAITSNMFGEVWVYDLTTGRQVGETLYFPERVGAVAAAPDGRLVVGFGREVAVLTRR